MIKKKIILNSLRKKILFYTSGVILLMVLTNFTTFLFTMGIINRMDKLFNKNISMKEFSYDMDQINTELYDYLSNKNSESLQQFFSLNSNLKEKIEMLEKETFKGENNFLIKDIINLTEVYLEESEKSIDAKRARKIENYTNNYSNTQKIFGYINYKVMKLNTRLFHQSTDGYMNLSSSLSILNKLNIYTIFFVIVVTIFFIIWFTFEITRPLIKLSNMAKEISRGNFLIEDFNPNTNDEVAHLGKTFNEMKKYIIKHISELKKQSEIEANFAKEKVQNLKMKNMLKNAELKSLQAQMNPHFLFNTLNAGVQLAMFENADRTGIFLEKLSNMLRYNLKNMNHPVPLSEEIKNIKNYIYLLEIRFGDLVKFYIDVQEDINDVLIPILTIQPLIENAFIHGIGDQIDGGEIKIKVYSTNNFIKVLVEDNGKGIDVNQIESILDIKKSLKNELQRKKGTGLGIGNVISRLNIFYDNKSKFNIESALNKGTKITLSIPFKGIKGIKGGKIV